MASSNRKWMKMFTRLITMERQKYVLQMVAGVENVQLNELNCVCRVWCHHTQNMVEPRCSAMKSQPAVEERAVGTAGPSATEFTFKHLELKSELFTLCCVVSRICEVQTCPLGWWTGGELHLLESYSLQWSIWALYLCVTCVNKHEWLCNLFKFITI